MSSPNCKTVWCSQENLNPSNVETISQELTPDEKEILPKLSSMFNLLEVSLILNTLRANQGNPEACVEELLILNLVHQENKNVFLEEVESRNAEEKPETVLDSVDNSQNAEDTPPTLSVYDTLSGNGNLHCNSSNTAIFEPVQGEREQSETVASELDPLLDYYPNVPSAHEVHRDWRFERMRKLELKKEKKELKALERQKRLQEKRQKHQEKQQKHQEKQQKKLERKHQHALQVATLQEKIVKLEDLNSRVESEKRKALEWSLARMQEMKEELQEKDRIIAQWKEQALKEIADGTLHNNNNYDAVIKQKDDEIEKLKKNLEEVELSKSPSRNVVKEGIQTISSHLGEGFDAVKNFVHDDWSVVEKVKSFASTIRNEIDGFVDQNHIRNTDILEKKYTEDDRLLWLGEKASLNSYIEELLAQNKQYEEMNKLLPSFQEHSVINQ